MSDGLIVLLAAAAVFSTAGTVYWLNTKGIARRGAALRKFAAEKRIRFIKDPAEHHFLAAVGEAGYLTIGISRDIHNLMIIERSSYTLQIFDIRYTYRGSDPRRRILVSEWFMPFVIEMQNVQIPAFRIRIRMPINPPDKSGQLPVELPQDNAFSRKFIITGDDPHAVAAMFTDEVRQFFRDNPFWSVSGAGNAMIARNMNHCWVSKMEKNIVGVESFAAALAKAAERLPAQH